MRARDRDLHLWSLLRCGRRLCSELPPRGTSPQADASSPCPRLWSGSGCPRVGLACSRISCRRRGRGSPSPSSRRDRTGSPQAQARDRKSTRLNSSHTVISYAVFCLKKKKKRKTSDVVQNKKKNRNI